MAAKTWGKRTELEDNTHATAPEVGSQFVLRGAAASCFRFPPNSKLHNMEELGPTILYKEEAAHQLTSNIASHNWPRQQLMAHTDFRNKQKQLNSYFEDKNTVSLTAFEAASFHTSRFSLQVTHHHS